MAPLTLFYLSMGCLFVGVVGAAVWVWHDARREARREVARAARKRELADAKDWRDDWRLAVPRRWRVERNVRYALWAWAEMSRTLARVFGEVGER